MPHLSPNALSDLKIFAAYAIFFGSYIVFAFGKFPGMKIDRPGAAVIGAVLMVVTGVLGPSEALRAVDFSTLVLLFSMMLIVAYLHQAGFFDWITELVVTRLKPCLVMVPFVLTATKRLGVKALPHLLAVATASNIGSVATITGNPQNMLIGSYSSIAYRDFFFHLGPVAAAGLFLDWLILSMLFPGAGREGRPTDSPLATVQVDRSRLVKPGIVIVGVLAGFILGAPPALMAAFGAAMMLITRTREPRQVYDEVDWGLLVFFLGLFLIVGGADKAGLTGRLLWFAHSWNLQHPTLFTVVTAALSNLVSNVPAVMLLKSMASTLAGNLTITGSVANIIVIERARREAPVSFRDYLKVGVPITIATLLVGLLWLWWID
ncbi:MAG: anion transporter [Acidobacteria bacterium]|nr:MAG: anion transporter [Acidobacteriota bacterium]